MRDDNELGQDKNVTIKMHVIKYKILFLEYIMRYIIKYINTITDLEFIARTRYIINIYLCFTSDFEIRMLYTRGCINRRTLYTYTLMFTYARMQYTNVSIII